MKIIQFTDIHIGTKHEETRDVNVRRNLKRVLKAVAMENADNVVLTGDLCFKEPREETCVWISKQLAKRDIDPIVIPGNHDDSVMLGRHFKMPVTGEEVYFARQHRDMRILYLDTARGIMSEDQWRWLAEHVNSAAKMMVFMHHPPVFAHVPFMDESHAFTQQERFQELLAERNDCVEIFCGHYHVDKSISIGNLHVHITPSCFFQIRDDIAEFGVDHLRIGYRLIMLDDDGAVSHRVKYL
jgi:Icc protein